MIHVYRATFKGRDTTVPLDWSHCKVNIKSTKEAKCLSFGTTKYKILTFVVQFSHNFPFVL